MTAGTLPDGTTGGDSDQVCTPALAEELYHAGVRFLLRYLSRTTPQNTGDISVIERAAILAGGISVGYVQHYPGSGWMPSAPRGNAYGLAAVANLKQIGAPPGVCVWRDWEGLILSATAEACIADMNAWNDAVASFGYVPGIYVGYDAILGASDLYWRLTCKHYWKSESTVPVPEVRGYQMIQSIAPSPVEGYDWDRDVVVADLRGGLPIWDLPA
jgi:Domain of unknown function (DUF1906)